MLFLDKLHALKDKDICTKDLEKMVNESGVAGATFACGT
jgi:hypothetical protein